MGCRVHGVAKSPTRLSEFHFHFGDFPVAQMVRNQLAMQETRVRSLGQEDLLEKEMAIHSRKNKAIIWILLFFDSEHH